MVGFVGVLSGSADGCVPVVSGIGVHAGCFDRRKYAVLPAGGLFPDARVFPWSASTARGLDGMQLHHRLTSSRLVLLLQQWTHADPGQMRPDVAEHLGQWLGAVDAVRLNGALHSIESFPVKVQQPVPGGLGRALDDACQGLQVELDGLIVARAPAARAPRGRGGSTPVEAPDPEAEADVAAHGQRYQGLQKQMEARLGTVRAQMRQWLAQGSPALRQLAALDAVMEQMLAAREQKLWALLPGCLEGRMGHWRRLHAQQLEASGQDDVPQQWRQPGGWLVPFEQDVRALWQAEVQVRLQPIMGLRDAARNENR